MKNKHFTAVAAFLGVLMLWATAASARVITLDRPISGGIQESALALVRAHQESLGARNPGLRLARMFEVPGGHVVRFQQVHQDLPVLGGEAVVLVQHNRAVALVGELFEIWPGLLMPASERVSGDIARSAARGAHPGARVRSERLAVLAGDRAVSATGRKAATVWRLDVITGDPLGLWDVLVEASTGRVLHGVSAMSHIKGQVYSTNPKVGSLVTRDLEGLTKKDELTGTHADVKRCKMDGSNVTCDRLAKPDTTGDFVYTPDEPKINDPFAEVQGYFHVDTFHRWMADSFKFSRAGDQQIDVVVNLHYTRNGKDVGYQNAFFGDINGDGQGDLSFGQSSRDFAYDADVVYHEFTHSAVSETSGLRSGLDSLGFNMMPASLNEGFADLFSSFFAGDPVLGDYMRSGGIRNLTGSASCPDSLIGESHNDGLILGQSVWSIRTKLSSAQQKVLQEVVYTTMSTLNKSASFKDAATLLLQTARARDAALAAAIEAELKARGVSECSRIVPLAEGASKKGYIYGTRSLYGLNAVPGPLQYKIDVPQTATALKLYVAGSHGGSVGAFVRKGDTVGYSSTSPTYDRAKDGSVSVLTIATTDGKNPLVPGATYYVLPMSTGTYTSTYTISYTLDGEQRAPDATVAAPDMTLSPDGGVGGSGDSGSNPQDAVNSRSGCSYSAGHGSAAGSLPLLALLALGLWGRFRRGRR